MKKSLRDAGIAAGFGLFYATYVFIPPVGRTVDLLVDPAVSGLATLYSKVSTAIAGRTGGRVRLGLIEPSRDSEFDTRVSFARLANEGRAGPLIEMAANKRLSNHQREDALKALLKFTSTADWLQPLLNELPKGGLVGLYDLETPILDALFRRVREEGGIRQTLVRDYAELVFSFMLQVPDAVPRSHAFRWLSDVLPEQALPMIIARIPQEKDPAVRHAIEEALFEVRAAPASGTAAQALVGFYGNLPWETLKLPLAVVLARMGDRPARQFLQQAVRIGGLRPEEKTAVDLALAGTPFPVRVDFAGAEAASSARAENRARQKEAAMIKRDRLLRQEKLQQEFLRKALDPRLPPYVGVRPSVASLPPMSRSISMTVPVDLTREVVAESRLYLGPDEKRQPAVVSTGTVVQVTAEAMASGRRWYRIDTDAGPRWVPSEALAAPTLAAGVPDTTDEGAFLEVMEDEHPVYAQPSADSAPVARLSKGNIVHVLGSEKKAGERWFEVELKAGEAGWIRGDLNLRLAGAGEE